MHRFSFAARREDAEKEKKIGLVFGSREIFGWSGGVEFRLLFGSLRELVVLCGLLLEWGGNGSSRGSCGGRYLVELS